MSIPLLALGLLAVAIAPSPARAQPRDARPGLEEWRPPAYVRELRFTCYPDRQAGLEAYFARLADADHQIRSGRMRWVDAEVDGTTVVVGVPAYRLAEYDVRPGSGPVFTEAFGAEAYRRYSQRYGAAQRRTHSVLRRYRDDLSLNRDRSVRGDTVALTYTYVTVQPGRRTVFESLAAQIVEAYAQVRPEIVFSTAETLSGGGPQYLVVWSHKSHAEIGDDLDVARTARRAFGASAADELARALEAVVAQVEHVAMTKVARDAFYP